MRDVLRLRDVARAGPLLLALPQVLLVALAVWWVVLVGRVVRLEDELARRLLTLRSRAVASELEGRPLEPGPLASSPPLELVPVAEAGRRGVAVGDSGLAVRPAADAERRRARRFMRRKVMMLGEGALVLVLAGATLGLPLRLVFAERRRRRDAEAFLARIAHEMKTPLAGLKALLQTLGEGRVPRDRLRELAGLGLRQADREEQLLENLLAARRMAERDARSRLAAVDLAGAVRDWEESRRGALSLRGRIDTRGVASHAVEADPGALQVVLDNLADNAFKYGASRLVLTSERAAPPTIRLAAEDDGQGFEPDQAEEIFRAFHRGAHGRQLARHGTGLGLSISRGLARGMGGDLVAESDGPGRGARFVLTLREPRGVGA